MISVRQYFILSITLILALSSTGRAHAAELDLSKAVILQTGSGAKGEKLAAKVLAEEVEKRTQIRWRVVDANGKKQVPNEEGVPWIILDGKYQPNSYGFNAQNDPLKLLGKTADAEGYHIRIDRQSPPAAPVVYLYGNDARGMLFAAGRLLREMKMSKGHISVDDSLSVDTSPKYPIRGHQLGYRPKTNSYDAWTVAMWEQYIRDLAVFGNNSVELIPPRSDDASDSPHFPIPQMPMMVEMSRICDEYDMDVWIWYPALDKDYSDPATVEFAIKEWAEVFKQLPRIDAVFVPGGDPGHTHPTHLMALLEKQTENLHKTHPKAQMWVAPQGFNAEWMQTFLDIMKQEPAWLTGIVFGPQVRLPLTALRDAIPSKYPIRHYPDITHSRHCQYPVPDWDLAFAQTEARECINPRPVDQAVIFRKLQPLTTGFITYSEGCNDDVNKIVWSVLGWDPETPVVEIVRDYSKYFIGDEHEEGFAQGLMSLEHNWRGPVLTNQSIDTTLRQFQSLEKAASPQLLLNWRFQQALYRAYYDAFVRSRVIYETALEERAMDVLQTASKTESVRAMQQAEEILDASVTEPAGRDLRARVFELGDALFQSIRMQLSVERHQAIEMWRGANLDSIDLPLNNAPWLKRRFAEIREMPSEPERLKEIAAIVNWTNPGPGGFYDDLGNPSRQPHLVRGPGFAEDPAFFQSSLVGFGIGIDAIRLFPISWWTHAESLHDQAPLVMQYDDLEPAAQYTLRVSYAGDMPRVKIRLTADDKFEIHPEIDKGNPVRLFEFDIPAEATQDGKLKLSWERQKGLGGNGRGCQVAETWLMRKGM